MAYRNFTRPRDANDKQTTTYWLDWMSQQGDILIPVAPHHDRSCRSCYGASLYRSEGDTWPECWNCHNYGDAVDTFVPATYCIDAGLESMLHRYKDRGVDWLRRPLASLLTKFVREHADCIDHDARDIDIATIVPSDNQARTFNHLDRLIRGTISRDPVFRRFDWDLNAIERDRSTDRPARGEMKPEAYTVDWSRVDGAAVLLLDDVWTSGSSSASAARAAKDAGAVHVTVLTLGRQLTTSDSFGSTAEIYDDRCGEDWSLDECVICA